MKRTLGYIVAFLIILTPACAVTVRESCYNDTHKLETFEYVLTEDGTDTVFNYTQLHLCLYNCSNSSGTCYGSDKEGDTMQMWMVFGLGAFLLTLGTVLGIPYGYLAGKGRIDKFDTRMVVRYLFFFVGFYLTYLSLGIARRIGANYGGVYEITGATEATINVMTWVLMLFAFMFVLEFMFTTFGMWKVRKEREKWGGWDEEESAG